MKGEKPTQRTVAEETGFAVTTVSRALAGDPKIAPETRKRIREAAERIGYLPDRAAQRLRTGRTNVITLVLDPHSEIIGFGNSMITGITEVLHGSRFHLTIMQYQLGEDPLDPIRHVVRNRLADGLIFARTRPQDARVTFLMERGFPFVSHGRTDLGPHAWVDYDNQRFAEQGVRHLAAKGCQRITLIPPAPRFTFHRHMVDGFRAGLAATGISGGLLPGADLNTPLEGLTRAIRACLQGPTRSDGFLCPGEVSTMAVAAAVRDEGLELGRDVHVVAKQTTEVFDLFRPRIDTIREDIEETGRELARVMMACIASPSAPPGHSLLTPGTGPAAVVRFDG
jgi:LacI family transcriptional regulator